MLILSACGDGDPATVSPDGDVDVHDFFPISDGDTDTPDGEQPDGDGPGDSPDIVATLAAPQLMAATAADTAAELATKRPRVFAHGSDFWVFYETFDALNDRFDLVARRSAFGDYAPGEAAHVAVDGFASDLRASDDGLLVLVAMRHSLILFEGTPAGDDWNWKQSFNSTNSSICQGDVPSYFIQNAARPDFILGYSHDSGIFGCANQTQLVRAEDDGWASDSHPQIGRGNPTFAYAAEDSRSLVTSFGIYFSADAGAGFEQLNGGDTTAGQLRGEAAVRSGDHLWALQTFSWGMDNAKYLALLNSPDNGQSWNGPSTLALSQGYFGRLLMAACGDFIWISYSGMSPEGTRACDPHCQHIAYSPDQGKSFSAAALVDDLPADRAMMDAHLACNGSRAILAYTLYLREDTSDTVATLRLIAAPH